jgi:hypothetical protein
MVGKGNLATRFTRRRALALANRSSMASSRFTGHDHRWKFCGRWRIRNWRMRFWSASKHRRVRWCRPFAIDVPLNMAIAVTTLGATHISWRRQRTDYQQNQFG